jgi:hypothetical protein
MYYLSGGWRLRCLSWRMEEQQGEEEQQQQLEDIMEGDVLASAQPFTLIDTPTPTHSSRHPLSKSRSSIVRGRADKQSIIFSHKRGRGH